MRTPGIPTAAALHVLAQQAGSLVSIVHSGRELAALRSGVLAPLALNVDRGSGCASVSQP
jgi:hypothetical protein